PSSIPPYHSRPTSPPPSSKLSHPFPPPPTPVSVSREDDAKVDPRMAGAGPVSLIATRPGVMSLAPGGEGGLLWGPSSLRELAGGSGRRKEASKHPNTLLPHPSHQSSSSTRPDPSRTQAPPQAEQQQQQQ
ncbi:hypothetical protein Pmani_032191, partial [Petrolisthes manimaculis]